MDENGFIELLLPFVSAHEGYEQFVYKDSEGNDTIGYGFLLSQGLTKEEAQAVLAIRLKNYLHELLSTYPFLTSIDPNRLIAIADMYYNLGATRFAGFHHFISALKNKDNVTAAAQVMDSDAARKLPSRYTWIRDVILSGKI